MMSTRLCSSGGSVEVVYSCQTIPLITPICMLTKHVAKAALSTAECSSYYYIEHSLHWTQSLIASGGLLPSIKQYLNTVPTGTLPQMEV